MAGHQHGWFAARGPRRRAPPLRNKPAEEAVACCPHRDRHARPVAVAQPDRNQPRRRLTAPPPPPGRRPSRRGRPHGDRTAGPSWAAPGAFARWSRRGRGPCHHPGGTRHAPPYRAAVRHAPGRRAAGPAARVPSGPGAARPGVPAGPVLVVEPGIDPVCLAGHCGHRRRIRRHRPRVFGPCGERRRRRRDLHPDLGRHRRRSAAEPIAPGPGRPRLGLAHAGTPAAAHRGRPGPGRPGPGRARPR